MEKQICKLDFIVTSDGNSFDCAAGLDAEFESVEEWAAVFAGLAEVFELNYITAQLAKAGIDYYLLRGVSYEEI